jgi:ABC-type transporter Mla subunit MlaD
MATTKITSSFIIGLFVLFGIASIVAVVMWLGANEFFKEKKIFITYFDGSIQGLEQGSPVKYLGVPVGNVSAVEIAPDGKLVEVQMQIDPKMKITPDMMIKSEYSGIAGGKFLQLFRPEKGESYSKIKLSFNPKFPVIYSAPSGIDEIAIAAKEVFNDLLQVKYAKISNELIDMLENFNALLKNENIKSSLENVKDVSNSLALLLNQLDTTRIIANVIQTSYNISNGSDELLSTIQSLKDKIQKIDINNFLDKVYGNYDSTMTNVDKTITRFSIRSELTMFSLQNLIEDLRKTNTELESTLQGITDDPSNIFLVKPPKKDE